MTEGKLKHLDAPDLGVEETVKSPGTDTAGRGRLVRNVFWSWAGHMVYVVSGFIMPRMIDANIGQSGLGVWDFGWSLVSYFGFVQAGIGSSINRFVAKYRAEDNPEGICCTVSSVMCYQYAASLVVLVLTILSTWLVPSLLSVRLGSHVVDARWVVFCIGTGLAVQLLFAGYTGVITGFHRWDLHNVLNSGFYALTVVGMIISLLLGGGLKGLAVTYGCGVVLTEATRMILAYRVYPQLRIGPKYVHWFHLRQMLTFGGKSFLTTVSQVVLYQTNSILVVSFLGPAALAVYSRPSSLVNHAMVFVNKFALVLTPTASCLQAQGRVGELRNLVVETTRYAAYMVLPMVMFLAILGGPLLAFWMGEDYQQGVLVAVLASGHMLAMIQQPVWNILAGMNAHGRLGLAMFVGALCSSAATLCLLGLLKCGLLGAAVSVAVALTISNGIYFPICVCRRLDMSFFEYVPKVGRGPVLCSLPFAACLVVARIAFDAQAALSLAIGGGSGAVILGMLYWRYVIPASLRARIIDIKHRLLVSIIPVEREVRAQKN